MTTEQLDQLAIVDLTIRYASAIDDREKELMREVFTDGCVLDFGRFGRRVMPAAVDEMHQAHLGFDIIQHRLFNHTVRITGDGGTCRYYVEAVYRTGDRFRRVHGQYRVQVARFPVGWRITDLQFDHMALEEFDLHEA